MQKILFIIILVLLINCGGVHDYYPLAVGNIWVYKTTLGPENQIGSETIEITRYTTFQGQEAFERVRTDSYDNMTVVDTSYIVEIEEFILGYWSKDDSIPDTILVLPLEKGKTWISENFVATVESLVDVEVPLGLYERCWLVNYSYSSLGWRYEYFAKNVGMVKSLQPGYDTFIRELESVDLK
jgi:hypothetical protein